MGVRRPPGWHASSGTWAGSPRAARRVRRVSRPPMVAYSRRVTAPIGNSYAQVVVNAQGKATLTLGPAGVGDRWRLAYCQVATSSGAADSSTVSLFLGPLPIGPLVGGQSYAGGGDSIGLPGTEMQPGDFLWALWSGAKIGDIASLAVYGEETALDIA